MPVIIATGDQALVREASAFLPGIETVQVKTSLDCRTTDCLPLLEARRQIENAAERALSRISKFKPVQVTKPIKTDVSFPKREHSDLCDTIPRARRTTKKTIPYSAENWDEASKFIRTTIRLAGQFSIGALLDTLSKLDGFGKAVHEWEENIVDERPILGQQVRQACVQYELNRQSMRQAMRIKVININKHCNSKADWMIQINAPQIGKEEIDAVVKVLKSGVLTHGVGAGPMVTEFEQSFAKYMKAKHAVAMNTGTAALHSALAAVGVKAGDEVILPSFTFVATAEVVAWCRAKPIFVDIDPVTYTISPKDVEKAVTKKTKAIIPVDLYGMPADLKPIREIADKHGLKIVEDAAQAHGATYLGKPAGAYADAACWSFYGSKNMTTGEGGMLTTNDEKIAEFSRYIRSHGEKQKYTSLMLGHNYHMPEIEAAIGCVQLRKLPKFVAKRRANAKRLTEGLEKAKSLQLPVEPEGFKCSYYLYTAQLKNAKGDKRNKFVGKLRENDIGAFVCYMNPIHLMQYYRKFGVYRLPVTEKVSKQVFSLPVHPGVTPKQIGFISDTVLRLL